MKHENILLLVVMGNFTNLMGFIKHHFNELIWRFICFNIHLKDTESKESITPVNLQENLD